MIKHLFFSLHKAAAIPPAVQAVQDVIIAAANQLIQWYLQIIVLVPANKFVFQTAANVSYQQPGVVKLWQANVLVADGVLALVILWIGYNVILGRYDPLEMLSRVVLAAVAIHGSLQFIGLFVELNNSMSAEVALLTVLPTTADLVTFLGFPMLVGANLIFQTLLIAAIIIIMAVVVLMQMLVRLAILDLLIVMAPLALLLYITPATQRWANLWAAAFFATLFLQFLQVVAISIGAALIATFFGTFSIVSALAGGTVLLSVLKIPYWLGNAVVSSIGSAQSSQGKQR
jgi:hypothetical protein